MLREVLLLLDEDAEKWAGRERAFQVRACFPWAELADPAELPLVSHLAALVPDAAAPDIPVAVQSEARSFAARAFAVVEQSELRDAVLAASADDAELVCSMLLVPGWAVLLELWASELAELPVLLWLALW